MGYLKAQRRAFRGGRTMIEPEKLIPLHGNYRHLKSFQVAQLACDVTVRFPSPFRFIGQKLATNLSPISLRPSLPISV
jgi:hypothetical protein